MDGGFDLIENFEEYYLQYVDEDYDAASAASDDVLIAYDRCPACDVPMAVKCNNQYVCSRCGLLREDVEVADMSTITSDMNYNTMANGLRCVGNNAYCYQTILRSQSTHDASPEVHVRSILFAYNHVIGKDGAVPKDILLNVCEQFKQVRTEGTIYRGTILRAILAAMTYYECLRNRLLFKPSDIYRWFEVDSQTYSKGDKKVREMLDHGFLPDDIRNIDAEGNYLYAYASKLDLSDEYMAFLAKLMAFTTKHKLLNPNAKSTTRALCVLHMFLVTTKHPIKSEEFRTLFRCNYGTIRTIALNLFHAADKFVPLFEEHGVPHSGLSAYGEKSKKMAEEAPDHRVHLHEQEVAQLKAVLAPIWRDRREERELADKRVVAAEQRAAAAEKRAVAADQRAAAAEVLAEKRVADTEQRAAEERVLAEKRVADTERKAIRDLNKVKRECATEIAAAKNKLKDSVKKTIRDHKKELAKMNRKQGQERKRAQEELAREQEANRQVLAHEKEQNRRQVDRHINAFFRISEHLGNGMAAAARVLKEADVIKYNKVSGLLTAVEMPERTAERTAECGDLDPSSLTMFYVTGETHEAILDIINEKGYKRIPGVGDIPVAAPAEAELVNDEIARRGNMLLNDKRGTKRAMEPEPETVPHFCVFDSISCFWTEEDEDVTFFEFMNVFSDFFKSYEEVLLADRIRRISLTTISSGQDMEHAKCIADHHAMEDEAIMRMETPVQTPDPSPTRTRNQEYGWRMFAAAAPVLLATSSLSSFFCCSKVYDIRLHCAQAGSAASKGGWSHLDEIDAERNDNMSRGEEA